MSRISTSGTSRSSWYSSHSATMWVLLSIALPHGQFCLSSSSSSTRLLVYLVLLSGSSRSSIRNRSFNFSAASIGPCKHAFIPFPFLNPPYFSSCSSSSTLRLSAPFYLFSAISFTFAMYPLLSPVDSSSFLFRPIPFHIFSTSLSHLIPACPFVTLFHTAPSTIYLAISFSACSLRYISISISSCLGLL